MNKINTIIFCISIVIVLISTLIILCKFYNDKITDILKKINEGEKSIYEKLKEKYSIIIRAINLVENKLKIESKTFEETKKLKQEFQVLIKNEKVMTKCFDEILKIKTDTPKSKNLRSFKDIIEDYDRNELHIISLRTYYNKYTMKYNNLIKKFPYNIVSKFKKYRLRLLFEGKELDKDD